jgi:two-component system response regulator AlgR
MKILIVDDEPLARERLKLLVSDLRPGTVLSTGENGLHALELINQECPDIVLMDIRMPGMDGIEAAFHISKLASPPAVVFTTAHQDHAIQAFEANAVDYLLKPVRLERLKSALDKATLISKARLESIKQHTDTDLRRQNLSSTNRGKIELIPVEEISYMKAEQKYISIGWKGRELLTDEALKSLETEFGDRFLRVHRNALVSKKHIKSLQKTDQDKYEIFVRDFDEGILVSRRHLQGVRKFLKSS